MIVSTRSSHLNQPISARVVRDIGNDKSVLIPIGAEVSGKLAKVIPPATPSDHAKLLLRYTQLSIPGHPKIAIKAHVIQVENAREEVLPDGTIQGILEKDGPQAGWMASSASWDRRAADDQSLQQNLWQSRYRHRISGGDGRDFDAR